jgi:hypothetical protein
MNPNLKTVKARDDYKMDLVFENGETGVFDCSPLLDFGVFRELRDLNYFKQVFVSFGTVTWPHEQDICPDTLYLTATGKEEQLMVAEESEGYGK